MNPARLLAASAIVGSFGFAANAANLRPEDASRHIGETGTVCGVVASAKFEADVQSQPTLLDSESRLRMRFLPQSSMEITGPSLALPKPRCAVNTSA